MKCPTCGADTFVVYTSNGDRRRRECFNEHRFTTIEILHERKRSAPRTRESERLRAAKRREIAHAQETSL